MPRRFHSAIAALAAVLCSAALANAQTSYPVSLRVQTSVPGATFWVDGMPYTNSAVFSWTEGSKHTLEIRNRYMFENAPPGIIVDPNQYNLDFMTRFAFIGWINSNQQTLGMVEPVQVITADHKVTSYTANFRKEHGVFFLINSDPVVQFLGACNNHETIITGSGLSASHAGFLETDVCGCMSTSGYAWVQEGVTIQLNPVAYPGYVFTGYTEAAGLEGMSATTLAITRPVRIRANFKAAQRVHVETAPYRGFNVYIDRNLVPTKRFDLDCLPLTSAPGFPSQTSPYPDPNFVWSDANVCKNIPLCNGELDLLGGSDHLLGSPPAQSDINGKLYVFDSWDTGDGTAYPANSVVHIPENPQSLVFTARFVEGARVAVMASTPGLKIAVDGSTSYQGYTFSWGVGHSHIISAPLEQRDGAGRLWRFLSWSNGGTAEQTIVVPAEAASHGQYYVAQYELLGQLTVKSEPGTLLFTVNGAACSTPCVLDRPAGEQVTIAPVLEQVLTPDTKIEHIGWDNSAAGERTYTFSQAAATVTARYQYLHRLNLLSDPEGGANWKLEPAAGPGYFFTAGVPVEISVTANEGFKFRRWDGALSGTYAQGSVTMSSPLTVVARFYEVPSLPKGAVRNAAAETPDPVVAAGSLIAIVGQHLAPDFAESKSNPLSQALAGVTVHVGDSMLPLIYVSPTEIRALLYSHFTPGERTLTVRIPGQPSVSTIFETVEYAPGLFRNPDFEQPIAEAYHTDGKPVTPDNPAKPGETILLCGTGFGPFKPALFDGFLVPEETEIPLAEPFELSLDGQVTPTLAAYAQPGRAGRVLIRFQLGGEAPAGSIVQIKTRVKERDSNTVLLPVESIQPAAEPVEQDQKPPIRD
jgi:uncharacterized protein (TIGR03437 family)